MNTVERLYEAAKLVNSTTYRDDVNGDALDELLAAIEEYERAKSAGPGDRDPRDIFIEEVEGIMNTGPGAHVYHHLSKAFSKYEKAKGHVDDK